MFRLFDSQQGNLAAKIRCLPHQVNRQRTSYPQWSKNIPCPCLLTAGQKYRMDLVPADGEGVEVVTVVGALSIATASLVVGERETRITRSQIMPPPPPLEQK